MPSSFVGMYGTLGQVWGADWVLGCRPRPLQKPATTEDELSPATGANSLSSAMACD